MLWTWGSRRASTGAFQVSAARSEARGLFSLAVLCASSVTKRG